jgi:hypothetical protein
MASDRYNIVFAGELVAGTDPTTARAKLAATFRLDQARLDGLFAGQPVMVKRNVDLITATRFQQAFLAAGARAEIESAAGEPESLPIADEESSSARSGVPATDGALHLAPLGALLNECDDRGLTHQPDTSRLSLLPAGGWDLSDCAPPPAPTPYFDLDGYRLEPLDVRRPDDAE